MQNRFKLGFLLITVVTLFAFQNCGKTEFNSIPSTVGDITDPVIQRSKRCEYAGKEYYHTEVIETYVASSVAYNQTCQKQKHTCQDGVWSGTIGFKDCGVEVAKDCKIGDETIKHGVPTERFQSARVAHDQNCVSEQRTCDNGNINGSFTFTSCRRDDPPAPTGQLVCRTREGQSNHMVQDLYEKWTDGTYRIKDRCSDWHIQRDNASWNCGRLADGIYGRMTNTAAQPSCCPTGYTVTNGICMPIAQRGEACYGTLNCADGLTCQVAAGVGPFGMACR